MARNDGTRTSSPRLTKTDGYDEVGLAELVHCPRLSCSSRLNDGAIRCIGVVEGVIVIADMFFEGLDSMANEGSFPGIFGSYMKRTVRGANSVDIWV